MATQFATKSLTNSGVTYFKVGFMNGMLLRPGEGGGVESTPAPDVAKALKSLGISTVKPIELQYKLEGKSAHFQWKGTKKNRDYGASFDVPNPWAKTIKPAAVTCDYLDESEMA